MKTYALSFSGGGSKGAYLVGAAAELVRQRPNVLERCKVFVGSSTGAFIATKLALAAISNKRHLHEIEKIYRSVTNDDVFGPKSSNGIWLLSTQPLENLVDQYISEADWRSLIQAGKEGVVSTIFTTYSINRLSGHLASSADPLMTPEYMRRSLLASASIPLLCPPVQIGDDKFVDGCLFSYSPDQILHQIEEIDEVSEIFSFNTEASYSVTGLIGGFLSQSYRAIKSKKKGPLVKTLSRTMQPAAPSEIVKVIRSIRNCKRHRKVDDNVNSKIVRFWPEKRLPVDPLTFRQPEMSLLVDFGKEEASKSLSCLSLERD